MIGAGYNFGLTRLQERLFPDEVESKNSVFQISGLTNSNILNIYNFLNLPNPVVFLYNSII